MQQMNSLIVFVLFILFGKRLLGGGSVENRSLQEHWKKKDLPNNQEVFFLFLDWALSFSGQSSGQPPKKGAKMPWSEPAPWKL